MYHIYFPQNSENPFKVMLLLYNAVSLTFSVLHCRNAIEQLCMFKRIERRPMAWPCQLTVGSCLSIRIVGYKAVGLVKVHQMTKEYMFITNIVKNVPYQKLP